MEHPERPTGTTFTHKGKTYKVEATQGTSCKGCGFINMWCTKAPTGPCWPGRSDGTPVIFVQIDPPPEPEAKPTKRRKR